MKSLKEQIEIMTAYLAGKIVETRLNMQSPIVGWLEYKPYDSSVKGELTFDWVNRDYRIKKEEIEIIRYAVFRKSDMVTVVTYSSLGPEHNFISGVEQAYQIVQLKGTLVI